MDPMQQTLNHSSDSSLSQTCLGGWSALLLGRKDHSCVCGCHMTCDDEIALYLWAILLLAEKRCKIPKGKGSLPSP